MMDTPEDIFKYHYFSPEENLNIRYGTAFCRAMVPAKGIFLLLHGRSEFIEKYKPVARQLQDRGFHVISPDWRGQGLSSRQLSNQHKCHVDRFEDYVDDLAALFKIIAAPQGLPVYILAHSMGGHIALRFMSKQPSAIKKAVLVSPMIDIQMPALIKSLSQFLAKKMARTFFAGNYTLGSKNYSAKNETFQGNILCHDPGNFRLLHDEIKKKPALALGGVTWGWLNAAFDSIEILKQDTIIEKITTPVLLVNAQKDAIVSSQAQEELSRKLPECTFLSIKGAFHELLFEKPCMTDQVWDAFNRFVPA